MLLKIGSRGKQVKDLQEFLGIGADGIFGSGTADAVKKWQADNGLDVDGLVGNATWNAMGLADTDNSESDAKAEDSKSEYSKNSFETSNGLEVIEYFMPSDEYKVGPTDKEYIFLHHTAGWHNPYNCIKQWDADKRGTIATEFVLGGPSVKGNDEKYDGVMVQAFPEGGYGWHLGKNGSQHMHTHSVG